MDSGGPGSPRHSFGDRGGTPEDGSNDKRLAMYRIPGLHEEIEFRGLRSWTAGLAFSPDGARLAATGFFGEGQALIWETAHWPLAAHPDQHSWAVRMLTFSSRQTWLAIRLDEGWTWGLALGLWKLPRRPPNEPEQTPAPDSRPGVLAG